jgi:steroid delta-isomerase-like uncharacterized protein
MKREEMDEVMDRHFAAEAAQDVKAILATLTPDAVHDLVGAPDSVLTDPVMIAKRYEELFADYADERIEPVRRLYGEDFIVDEGLFTGTAVGTPFGMPGNGRRVAARLLHVCEFREGRISRENVWMDVGAVVAQLS